MRSNPLQGWKETLRSPNVSRQQDRPSASAGSDAVTPKVPGGNRVPRRYGWYCCSIAQMVSTWTRIQTPVSSGSNSTTGFAPRTSCASAGTVIGVAPNCAGSPFLVRTVTRAFGATMYVRSRCPS